MNSIMQKIESLDDVKKRNERKIKLFINSEYPDLIKLGEIMKRCRKKNRCICRYCGKQAPKPHGGKCPYSPHPNKCHEFIKA